MKNPRFLWFGFATCLLLILLTYRFSKPGKITVHFKCDERLKYAFECALEKLEVDYKQSSSDKSTLIVFDDHLTYHGQVFRFYWNDTLEKKIVDMVSSHIKVEGKIQSQLGRFEQFIKVYLADQTEVLYNVRPEISDFNEMVYKIIKDILKGDEKIFENGYLMLSLSIERDGKKLMIYDSKNDQFYTFLELGGS